MRSLGARGMGSPARRLVAAVLASSAVALLASCGSSPIPPGGSPTTRPPASSSTTGPTTTTTSPGSPCGVAANPDVVFTSRTEPCAVTTHVGVTIHLGLDRGFIWNDLKSDSSVIEVTNVQRPTSGGGLDADLRAVAVGHAAVTTAGGAACPPGEPCPQLARLWRLDITVVESRPPPQTVTVTEADSGHTFTVRKGDGLDVELTGPSSYTWTEPTTAAQGVLQRLSGTSGPTANAVFVAVGNGAATVTATNNPNCYPRCLAPSRVFEVNVSVTG